MSKVYAMAMLICAGFLAGCEAEVGGPEVGGLNLGGLNLGGLNLGGLKLGGLIGALLWTKNRRPIGPRMRLKNT